MVDQEVGSDAEEMQAAYDELKLPQVEAELQKLKGDMLAKEEEMAELQKLKGDMLAKEEETGAELQKLKAKEEEMGAELQKSKGDMLAKEEDMRFLMEQLLSARTEISEAHQETDGERKKRGFEGLINVCKAWRGPWKGKAFQKWREEIDDKRREEASQNDLKQVEVRIATVQDECDKRLHDELHSAELAQSKAVEAAVQKSERQLQQVEESARTGLEKQQKHLQAAARLMDAMHSSRSTAKCKDLSLLLAWAQNAAVSKKEDQWQARTGDSVDVVVDLRMQHQKALEAAGQQLRIAVQRAHEEAGDECRSTIRKQQMILERARKARQTTKEAHEKQLRDLIQKVELAQKESAEVALKFEEQGRSSSERIKTCSAMRQALDAAESEIQQLRHSMSLSNQQSERGLQVAVDAVRLRGGAAWRVAEMLLSYCDRSRRKQVANMRSNFLDYKHALAVEMEARQGTSSQERDAALAKIAELEESSRQLQAKIVQLQEELAATCIRADAGEAALHHFEHTVHPAMEEMDGRINQFIVDDELETVRCRLLSVRQMYRWGFHVRHSQCANSVRTWHTAAFSATVRAQNEKLENEIGVLKENTESLSKKAEGDVQSALVSAQRDGRVRGGIAAASAALEKQLWGGVSHFFRHWAVETRIKSASRKYEAECSLIIEKELQGIKGAAAADAVSMQTLLEPLAMLQADLENFKMGAIDAEAELKLLTGCDIKIGKAIVKTAEQDNEVIERGDALTMLETHTALKMADGLLCNMKIDIQKAFEDDSDSDEDDRVEEKASPPVATEDPVTQDSNHELALQYLEEEITSRKIIEAELLSVKLNQALLLLSRSPAIGGLQQTWLQEMFTWWKHFTPTSKRTTMGCVSGLKIVNEVLTGWKQPALSMAFERWFFQAQDLLRKRVMYCLSENYRLLRGRMSWREKQTLVCQSQLKAVLAERDAIADFKTEELAAHLREESNLLGSQDMLRDLDMARAVAGANAFAQNAETIARANIGSVWPEADRFKLAVNFVEEAIKTNDDPKEMDNMLQRWEQDLGLVVPDEHSRKLDESLRKLSEMVIDGKDWSLDDCLEGTRDDLAFPGVSTQSVFRGCNPFSRKISVTVAGDIDEQFGASGRWVYEAGKTDMEATPQTVNAVWASQMRLKAALEAKERMHQEAAAKTKSEHQAAIKQILAEVDALVEKKVGTANRSGASTAAQLQKELDETKAEKNRMQEELKTGLTDGVAEVAKAGFTEAMQAWRAAAWMGLCRWATSEMHWSFARWVRAVMACKFNAETRTKLNEDAIFGSKRYIPKPAHSSAEHLIAQISEAEAMWNTNASPSKSVSPKTPTSSTIRRKSLEMH